MKNKIFLYLFLFLIAIKILTISSVKKININQLNKIPLKKDNPICCLNEYCVDIEGDSYSLKNKTSQKLGKSFEHSNFHTKTYHNKFKCLRTSIKNILNFSNPNRICIFGFGLGGLAMELAQNEKIKRIDCVDIDERMFIFFNSVISNPSPKIHYYLGDCREYIKHTDNIYDVIMDDAYLAHNKYFYDYSLVAKRLRKGGIFLIHLHYLNDCEERKPELLKYFSSVVYDHCDGYIVICTK